jgi:prephenate dehydrogenase
VAQVTVIGTGLIGTSLGLALRASTLRNLTVVGTDANATARSGAQRRQAFDRMEGRLGNAIQDADVIVLATPVMAMRELMEGMASYLPDGCVVTDVGSTKTQVLQWADELLPDSVDFVGGHPMAGRETPGPENADGALFAGKPYCVIPSPRASQRAVGEITTLAEAVGGEPYFIGVDEHDSFVAAVSHLPFVLSTALVGCTSKSANWSDIGQLASSGYRDITRLASGDAVMHRDICVSNAQPIVAWIDAFIRELYEYRKILDTEPDDAPPDIAAMLTVFEDANLARAKWLAGEVNPRSREVEHTPDYPTFSQSMGQMLLGGFGERARRLMMGGGDDDRERRSGERRPGDRR